MFTATAAANAARSVAPGTPEHSIACELCVLRGFDPNGLVQPVSDRQAGLLPEPIPNWQWIIAEQLLEVALRHMLKPRMNG